MKKIGSLMGKRLLEFPVMPDVRRPHPHTSVGIEVEVEGNAPNYREFESKRWRATNEGSLNGGIEYISEPVWGTAIVDALDELAGFFEEYPPYISFRTSIHIHVNVLDMYPTHLERMVKGYITYERPLYRLHSNWNRYDNIFCIPAHQSVAIQRSYAYLLSALAEGKRPDCLLDNKYQGLNPNCLRTLGTLEFRQMGGTDDPKRILKWIDILLRLKASAQDEVIALDDPAAFWGPQFGDLDIHDGDVAEGSLITERLAMWR